MDYRRNSRDDELAGLSREQRETVLKAKEMSSRLSNDIERQMDEYERSHPGEEDKEEKFLGFIPMPGYMIGVLETSWNSAFGFAAPWLQKNAYNLSVKHLPKLGVGSAQIKPASITIATAVAVAPLAWQPITRIFNGFNAEKKDLSDAAKKIAPVLDDITGKHSLGSFMKIKAGNNAGDNDMIYAHRKHKQRLHQLVHTNDFISLANVVPSLVLTGLNSSHVISQRAAADAAKIANVSSAGTNTHGNNDNAIQMASGVASGVVTPMLEAFQKINERKHKKTSRSVTAIDMVLELEKQISGDSKQRDYMLPKGSSKRSAPLTDYVMEIIKCHQLDMEALDAEYVPIRKALDNQLRDVATPIAEAIQKGDLSTLALIRLIGEGHVIKNQGRSLAKPSEIKAQLEKMGAHTAAYTQLDPKEYFADAAFNKKELKEAMNALTGEEKQQFSALFPDAVLREIGMSEDQVKDLRAATVKGYEVNLAKIVTGLAAEDDQVLHDIGLAKEEVKEIREAAEKIKVHGEEAAHDMRAKPNNPIGIERLLASAAISKIVGGDVAYFGKLTSQAIETQAEGSETSHAAKITPNKKHAAEHAEHAGHAARESHRREGGFDHHEVSA